MPGLETGRHQLPLLAVSQAQKEVTHNEALVLIDALLHMVVEDALSIPPLLTDDDIGRCWLITGTPSGPWQSKSDQIAVWIGGSWRFVIPQEGMWVRNISANTYSVHVGGQWIVAPATPNPTGGNVVDVEARLAIGAILHYFRLIGIMAT